jgi:hypothetical protein
MKNLIFDTVERVSWKLDSKNKKNGRYLCIGCQAVWVFTKEEIFCPKCNTKRKNQEKLAKLLLRNLDDVCNAFTIACKNLPEDSPKFKKDIFKLRDNISKFMGKI